jgi:hypothetical protein
MGQIHQLLTPSGSGLDQQTHGRRNPSKGATIGLGSLNTKPKGVIYPRSYLVPLA